MRNYGYMRCPCCGRRQRIYVGEVWTGRMTGVQVRIVEPCRDGAIVEQLDRPQDGRFALSWRDLGGAFDPAEGRAVTDGLVLVESSATFSGDRRYRYTLTRRFADGPTVAFVGLNPSTADEHADDPTIRRCLGFARRWGYGTLVMLNLYALRSTDPRGLTASEPRGEVRPGALDRNLLTIMEVCLWWPSVERVVCAWGTNPGPIRHRPDHVLAAIRLTGTPTTALALTKHGHPRHPLYVRADVEPIPFPVAAAGAS